MDCGKGNIMISPKMLESFNNQLNAELYSSYLYLSMSSFFDDMGLKKGMNGVLKPIPLVCQREKFKSLQMQESTESVWGAIF